MIIIMKKSAGEQQIKNVQKRLQEAGFGCHLSRGVEKTVIGAIGDRTPEIINSMAVIEGIEKVVPVLKPFKLSSRDFNPEATKVRVGEAVFGGEQAVIIAGPCAIETEEQLLAAALAVKKAGARLLRGGAFKPRTSPYSFQGLKTEGLKLIQKVSRETGLPVVSEVMSAADVELVAEHVQMLQIGARNMQNFPLLQEVGKTRLPVLLKRGIAATIEEWLMAAEYIIKEGNDQVVLCERGIRTFEKATRNTLDISAISLVKQWSHLPVIADPSHASGLRGLIAPLSRAALAAGADGLMIEVHPEPEKALCDGAQSLNLPQFARLMQDLAPILEAVERV